jgi:hypothetical protein
VPFSVADHHGIDTRLGLVDESCLYGLRGEFRTCHRDVGFDICLQRADSIGTKCARLRQNPLGSSLGGQIFTNKAFFHGDAEFFRQIRGGLPSALTVSTLYQQRNPGDFSDTNTTSGCSTIS